MFVADGANLLDLVVDLVKHESDHACTLAARGDRAQAITTQPSTRQGVTRALFLA